MLDIIDACAGDKYFSAFDLQDGFWCILLHIADRHKTAFATHNMLLEWTVCPQGSKNGAVVFARIIQNVMRGAPATVSVFQDDIFNHTSSFADLMDAHQFTFDALSARGLTAKMKKMKLNFPRMKCLGHMVTSRGRCPDPDSVQAILDVDIPKTLNDLLRFNGLVTFNRDYIPNLGDIAAPLYDLLAKEAVVSDDWKDEIHGVAFRHVKHLLVSSPFLQLPDPSRPFRIHVDGCLSGREMGAVLLQQDMSWIPGLNQTINDAPWRPVAYWSKKLETADRSKFSATMVEAHALHESIMHWASYLQNGLPFTVIVDHQALVYLITTPVTSSNRRVLTMCNHLSAFTFNVLYKRGATHLDADAISRLFRYEDNTPLSEPASSLHTVKESDILSLRRWMSLDKEFMDSGVPDPSVSLPPTSFEFVTDDFAPEDAAAVDMATIMSISEDN
jgi:hypothetical protein